MKNLSKENIIKIILISVVVIVAIATIIVFVKKKNTKTYIPENTVNVSTEIVEEKKELEPIEEDVEEVVGDVSWDEETVEETKVDEEEEKKQEKNSNEYYIKVNYTANCVTVYKKDESGNYTIPVKALICSTGTATPKSGVYKSSSKYRWLQLNGGVYGQYCTRITGHILFHSVPCASKSPDSLKYTAYDKLGTTASAGCVRLTVEGALWIYSNCPSGTYVEFYSSSDPGPLGKPSAQKISWNVECRDWDPTDPDSNNPWHSYVEPQYTETVKVEEPKIEVPQPVNPEPTNNQDTPQQSDIKPENNVEESQSTNSEPKTPEENPQQNNTESEQTEEEHQQVNPKPEIPEDDSQNTSLNPSPTENTTNTENQKIEGNGEKL